jgi:predicted alpha/beta superfamily hydrolase
MCSSDGEISSFQRGIEVARLGSAIIDQDFELAIKLPWRYHESDAVYPVLFTLDANRSFPLYATMSLIYETPPAICEEVVIVGVGYRLDDDRIRGLAEWAAWRTRDLTPVRNDETERFWQEKLSTLIEGEGFAVRSGGAAAFLDALCTEIIPFVEANYRVSPNGRGLAGYSYGGLFALFALFHAPETFQRFFAGSPSMWDELFAYEEEYAATHNDLEATLLMTGGSLETDLHEPMQRFVHQLRERNYPSLNLETHIFEGESHVSGYAAAVSRALCVLYGGG